MLQFHSPYSKCLFTNDLLGKCLLKRWPSHNLQNTQFRLLYSYLIQWFMYCKKKKHIKSKFQINTTALKTQNIQMLVNPFWMLPKLLKITITFHATNALQYCRHQDVSLFLNLIIHHKSMIKLHYWKNLREQIHLNLQWARTFKNLKNRFWI